MSKLVNQSDRILVGTKFIEIGKSYERLQSSLTRMSNKGADGEQGPIGPQGPEGPQGQQGEQGPQGESGRGVVSIIEYYKTSNSSTTPPSSGWVTTLQVPDESKPYLWNYEHIVYTDSTTSDTTAQIISQWLKGRGITSITEYYKTNNSKSNPPTSGWVTALQVPDATNPYLWNYEHTIYTDGTDSSSTPQIISQWVKGDKGDTGETGETGPQGPKGDNGQDATQYYYHTVYVNNTSTGEGYAYQNPNGQLYTGTYIDTTVEDAQTWAIAQTKTIKWNYTKGAQGDKGDTGNTGPQGPQGIQGIQGEQGIKGDDGADGSDGADGISVTWKGNLSTAPANPQKLWAYYNTTDKKSYIYNGTAWEIMTVDGVKGDKGDKGDTGNTGPQGPKGDDAYIFSLIVESQTYIRNLRLSTNQPAISVGYQVSGYEGSINITTQPSGLYSGGALTIPYDNDYDTITITANYGSAPIQTATLNVVDETGEAVYLGYLSDTPETYGEQNLINGDYMVCNQQIGTHVKGTALEYQNGEWISTENINSLLNSLNKLMENGVDLNEISNANSVSWFNTIVASKIFAESIKANIGEFKDLLVTGSSKFYGEIISTALTTVNGVSTSVSRTISHEAVAYWKKSQLFNLLDNLFVSDGYYELQTGSTYAKVRRSSLSSLRIYSGEFFYEGGSHVSRFVAPYTGTFVFKETYSSASSAGYYVYNDDDGSLVGSVPNDGTVSFNLTAGVTYRVVPNTSYSKYAVRWEVHDTGFADKYTFVNSAGNIVVFANEYVSGICPVVKYSNQTIQAPALYQRTAIAQFNSANVSTGTLTYKNESGSIVANNKPIRSVAYESADRIVVTTTDSVTYEILANAYYQVLSGSFSIVASTTSAEITTLTPKAGTDTLGKDENGKRWVAAYIDNVYGNSNGTHTGNVNSAGTTNKVYGAVFN